MNPLALLARKLAGQRDDYARCNILWVALGDSVTQGLGLNPLMLGEDVYHQVVRRRLVEQYPHRAFSVINAGVGGDSASGALGRLQRDVLDHHPDLVTICFALNDSGRGREGENTFRESLRQLVKRCTQDSAVILLTPNMMATRDNPRVPDQYKAGIESIIARQKGGTMDRYVQIIRDVAEDTSTPLADPYARWKQLAQRGQDITDLLINGINHPDARGHLILADALWETLRRSLDDLQ